MPPHFIVSFSSLRHSARNMEFIVFGPETLSPLTFPSPARGEGVMEESSPSQGKREIKRFTGFSVYK
jgi:hypothetical protein